MGNNDSFIEGILNYGQNEVIPFEGGYFSFALGDEIAFKADNSDKFYILNCDEELWTEVKKKLLETRNKKELKKFWLEKSKENEISEWSAPFSNLKKR